MRNLVWQYSTADFFAYVEKRENIRLKREYGHIWPYPNPIYDQPSLGSKSEFDLSTEYVERLPHYHETSDIPSRLFLYYQQRAEEVANLDELTLLQAEVGDGQKKGEQTSGIE